MMLLIVASYVRGVSRASVDDAIEEASSFISAFPYILLITLSSDSGSLGGTSVSEIEKYSVLCCCI